MTKHDIRLPQAVIIIFYLWCNTLQAENRYIADVNGVRYMSVIKGVHVEKTPIWNPAEGNNPPLNVSNAYSMARKELVTFFDNDTNKASAWKVSDIQLACLESWRRQDKWCYIVNFVHEKTRNIFPIVVLLDGTAIHPQVYIDAKHESKSQIRSAGVPALPQSPSELQQPAAAEEGTFPHSSLEPQQPGGTGNGCAAGSD